MNLSFSPDTVHSTPNSLVPAGTLTFATLTVRGLKKSKSTGGEYADLELILQGEYAGRRIWPLIMNPMDPANSEGARGMGMAAIQHICEASGLFVASNPQSYQRFANASFIDVLKAIDGAKVAIKVGIEKGGDGYQDKNRVLVWLTPNPASSDAKLWGQLLAGGNSPAQGGFSLGGTPTGAHTPAAQSSGAAIVGGGATPDWLSDGGAAQTGAAAQAGGPPF